MRQAPKNVNDYIAKAPKKVRGKLKELRAIIKKAAPKAEERISYGMPYYAYKGRLVYFAYFKNHISLFVPTPIIEECASELKNFETTKATVHFPLDKPLPIVLIKKLIRARIKNNEKNIKNK